MIPQGFIASLPPRLHCKQVLTIHAAGLFALRRLPLGKYMARRIVNRSDLIYSVSSYNQQILQQLVQHKVDCRILPMGIDTYYYENHSDPAVLHNSLNLPAGKIILYVGKLNEKKGVIGVFPCGKECRKYTFYLDNPVMNKMLIRRGNTIFYQNTQIPKKIDEFNIDRVVVQPEVPH